MKTLIQLFSTLVIAGLLVSCGKSGGSSRVQPPDPATQPEAQAAVFQRIYDRAKSLIDRKEYKQAQQTLDALKNYKLTADQQKLVDQLQAQVPKAN